MRVARYCPTVLYPNAAMGHVRLSSGWVLRTGAGRLFRSAHLHHDIDNESIEVPGCAFEGVRHAYRIPGPRCGTRNHELGCGIDQ